MQGARAASAADPAPGKLASLHPWFEPDRQKKWDPTAFSAFSFLEASTFCTWVPSTSQGGGSPDPVPLQALFLGEGTAA